MNHINQAFRDYLLDQSPITELVGEAINWAGSPQGTAYPRITYNVQAYDETPTLDGTNRHVRATLKTTIRTRQAEQGPLIAGRLRAALHGFRGTMGAHSIDAIFLKNYSEAIEAPPPGDSEPVFRVQADFDFCHMAPDLGDVEE